MKMTLTNNQKIVEYQILLTRNFFCESLIYLIIFKHNIFNLYYFFFRDYFYFYFFLVKRDYYFYARIMFTFLYGCI
jgi:hypothetical protein